MWKISRTSIHSIFFCCSSKIKKSNFEFFKISPPPTWSQDGIFVRVFFLSACFKSQRIFRLFKRFVAYLFFMDFFFGVGKTEWKLFLHPGPGGKVLFFKRSQNLNPPKKNCKAKTKPLLWFASKNSYCEKKQGRELIFPRFLLECSPYVQK